MGGFNLPVFGGGPTYGSTYGNVSPSGGGMNPFAAGLIPAFSGAAGAFGGQPGKTSGSSSGSSSGTSFGTTGFSSNPLLSGPAGDLQKAIRDSLLNQYNQGTDLTGYKNQQMQQIAGQGRNNEANIANSLAARGLSYSPAAAASLTQNTLNTGNQQSSFLQQLPLLQRQLNQGNIAQLIQGFTAMPYGQSGSSNTNQGFNTQQNQNFQQQTQQPGGILGGLLSGLGSGLGAILPLL